MSGFLFSNSPFFSEGKHCPWVCLCNLGDLTLPFSVWLPHSWITSHLHLLIGAPLLQTCNQTLWFIRLILKERLCSFSGVWDQVKRSDTYPLLEQLCDLLFVLLQLIFHLSEMSHRELLPVVRTELLQLGLSLACRETERTRGHLLV